MTEIKNLPNMTIDELEKFAKGKLKYQMMDESISMKSINKKYDEEMKKEIEERDQNRLNHLSKRLEEKAKQISAEVEKMNFLQVIQML